MAHTDYLKAFLTTEVAHLHPDWNKSFYDVRSDAGALRNFTFTTTKAQEMFV